MNYYVSKIKCCIDCCKIKLMNVDFMLKNTGEDSSLEVVHCK